jgi:hypothetical protein
MGKAKIGGPFTLVDFNGNIVTGVFINHLYCCCCCSYVVIVLAVAIVVILVQLIITTLLLTVSRQRFSWKIRAALLWLYSLPRCVSN